MEVENDLNYFSKYLTLFYTRHKNYILVLIYYVFCGKSPPFLSIQLFYPSSIQHRKKILKKLVIKAVSVNILLFDLNIYKVYLAEKIYRKSLQEGRETICGLSVSLLLYISLRKERKYRNGFGCQTYLRN